MEDITLEQAVELLLARSPQPQREEVPLMAALGRIVAADIRASFDNPPFDRSPLDGYALRAADTEGGDCRAAGKAQARGRGMRRRFSTLPG